MPGLNKQQKEFRKQMQELQKIETYKNVMDDHDSFYHNKAYEQKKLIQASKNKRNNNIITIIIFIFLIIGLIYINFDLVKSTYLAFKNYSKFNQNFNQIINYDFNKLNLSNNEIKQYKIGIYHRDYTKKIEMINNALESNINTGNITQSDILKIYREQNFIDELIIEFESYVPDEINKELHFLNIEQLYNYKQLYAAAEVLASGSQDINIIYKYNKANSNITILALKYREKILLIFHEIDMKYNILENNSITFTYPSI